MLFSRPARVTLPVFFALALALGTTNLWGQTTGEQAGSAELNNRPPSTCNVTLPSEINAVRATRVGIGGDGMVAAYGTEKFRTLLPTDGIWRGRISNSPDEFAYDNKLPWLGDFSYTDGPITVTGKRLDGSAPSFTEIQQISGRRGTMGAISIPVFGCWEITGRYKDQELSFVVWVTPVPEQPTSTPVTPDAPQPPRARHRVRVDGSTEAQHLVYRLNPELPHEARIANISGTVVLHALIGQDGRPNDLQYLSGPLQLAQAAINSVKWWQYMITDDSSEIETTIDVLFPKAEGD